MAASLRFTSSCRAPTERAPTRWARSGYLVECAQVTPDVGIIDRAVRHEGSFERGNRRQSFDRCVRIEVELDVGEQRQNGLLLEGVRPSIPKQRFTEREIEERKGVTPRGVGTGAARTRGRTCAVAHSDLDPIAHAPELAVASAAGRLSIDRQNRVEEQEVTELDTFRGYIDRNVGKPGELGHCPGQRRGVNGPATPEPVDTSARTRRPARAPGRTFGHAAARCERRESQKQNASNPRCAAEGATRVFRTDRADGQPPNVR